jgi:hypothetical protein
MAWNPALEAPDTRKLVPNVAGFFRTNSAAAVTWANGGQALPGFVNVWDSEEGRVHKYFPDVTFLSESVATHEAAQGIEVDVELILLVLVVDKTADAATSRSRKYIAATESMLLNIPPETLTAGTSLSMGMMQELTHSLGQEGKLKSQHFRAAQVRVRWKFTEVGDDGD